MRRWFGKSGWTLALWYPVALAWLGHVALTAMLTVFRAMKASGIAGAIQFNDIPLLRHFDTEYRHYHPWLAVSGLALCLVLTAWCWRTLGLGSPFSPGWFSRLSRLQVRALLWMGAVLLYVGTTVVVCWPLASKLSTVAIQPISWLDWTGLGALCVCGWLMPSVVCAMSQASRPPDTARFRLPQTSSFTLRNGMLYVLGCAAVMLYALRDHLKFWDPAKNGGFEYRPFFRDGEIADANLVLYSTSVLFASLAAIGGCIVVGMFRALLRRDVEKTSIRTDEPSFDEGRSVTILSAAAWAGILIIPWQLKLLPEIEAERGWIFPATTLLSAMAALIPLLHVSGLMMTWDFERSASQRLARDPDAIAFVPRRSELAVWNFVLFAVYPWIRVVRAAGSAVLYVVATIAVAGMIAGLTWFASEANDLYEFEDWRGMLKSCQFPFMRVAFALMCACFAYVVLRRLVLIIGSVIRRSMVQRTAEVNDGRRRMAIARVAVCTLVAANLAFATWPFWGWKGISENVFTRTNEYSKRHEFELNFLHWLFDFDRDGYAAVLHGGDPDDFNASIQAGRIDPPRAANDVPIDAFAVVDPVKARELPNVMFIFLEGVAPESICAYTERTTQGTLPSVPAYRKRTAVDPKDGKTATHYIDSVALDGTIFTEARCFYPSTWDGWFSTVSGRFLRIKEADLARKFDDRYSRYNNLNKVLQLAGVNRWCHMSAPPYYKMLVHHDLKQSPHDPWWPDFDYEVTAEQEADGVWVGDRRNYRILQFLDNLKPGEKFFLVEHMADTHFPWREVKELEWAGEDAVLHNGGRNRIYERYFQNITRMDRQVGALLKKLKEKKLYDNTIIVIVSDHGCQWWQHEHMYYVEHLYDPAIVIPMIVKIPTSIIPADRRVARVSDPVLQVDLLRTIMDLAGVEQVNPREDYPLPGHSLLPLIKGTATAAEKEAYRKRDMPLMTHYDKLGVISEFRHKLIYNRPAGTYKLFDLKHDKEEMHNLVDENPELVQEMLGKLRFQIRQNPVVIGGIKGSDGSAP